MDLHSTFAAFGNIVAADVMVDAATGQSKGFGTLTSIISTLTSIILLPAFQYPYSISVPLQHCWYHVLRCWPVE